MFAYGVCALFACCMPAERAEQEKAVKQFVEDGRRLADWSRASAASKDRYLPPLLDNLLQPATTRREALALRLSAGDALRHPFHDVEAAMAASAEAQEQAASAQQQATQRQEEVEREAQRRIEELQSAEAAQMRQLADETSRQERELAEKEEEMRAAVEADRAEVERRKAEVARGAASLAQAQALLEEEEAEVRRAQLALEAVRSATEAEQRTARSELERVRRRQQEAEELARRARSKQQEAEVQEQQARQRIQREQDQLRAAKAAVTPSKWTSLAVGVSVVEEVKQFFARRQPSAAGGGQALRIETAVRIANDRALSAFVSAGAFHVDPLKAHRQKADTLLFHGTAEVAVANIQASGLLVPGARGVGVAHGSMLGNGIYGAPDPRKSLQYVKGNNRFMFICRFNLSGAQHAGPSTQHRNSVFDEFCVSDAKHVVVLWLLKLAP